MFNIKNHKGTNLKFEMPQFHVIPEICKKPYAIKKLNEQKKNRNYLGPFTHINWPNPSGKQN